MKCKFSILLALMMLITMISGCGGNTASVSEAAKSAEVSAEGAAFDEDQTTAEASSAVEESFAETAEDSESEGYTVGFPSVSLPLTDEDITFELLMNMPPNTNSLFPNGLQEHPVYAAAAEMTGVNLDYVALSSPDQLNLLLLSDDLPDLYSALSYDGGDDKAVEDEFAIALNDYLEEYAPNYSAMLQDDDAVRKQIVTDEGNIVFFYTFNSEEEGATNGPFIRTDWLDKVNMEKPITYDEWHDVLKAFQSELGATEALMLPAIVPSNNFLCAGYGVAGTSSSQSAGVNAAIPYYVEDGVVKYGIVEDGYYDYMCMIRQWISEGLIDPEFYSKNSNPMGDAYTAAISNGTTGIFFNDLPMYTMFASVGTSSDPDFHIEATYDARKNAEDVIHNGTDYTKLGNGGILITTACEYPELAVQWCDFWYSTEGVLMANYGVEGLSYEYDESGLPQQTEIVTNNPDGYSQADTAFMYTMPGVSSIVDVAAKRSTYTSEQLDARDIWDYQRDGSNSMPSGVTMTAEEGELHNNIYSDIDTYVSENLLKFYLGEKSLDEWDAFIDDIYSMNIEACIQYEQDAYDRYLSK